MKENEITGRDTGSGEDLRGNENQLPEKTTNQENPADEQGGLFSSNWIKVRFPFDPFSDSLKTLLFILTVSISTLAFSQEPWNEDEVNTAKGESYLTDLEIEMIAEINRVRSNPKAYARLLIPYLDKAESVLISEGRGAQSYSITTTYVNGKKQPEKKNYHYTNEEEVRAIRSLIDDLENMEPVSILKPDQGIHKALLKHAEDQKPTRDINHRGTDGSWPGERITRFSPDMISGNENIAGGSANPRGIVILLLIDSGIPGYGHRYNMLNPDWTHVSCLNVGDLEEDAFSMNYWIQNFGRHQTAVASRPN